MAATINTPNANITGELTGSSGGMNTYTFTNTDSGETATMDSPYAEDKIRALLSTNLNTDDGTRFYTNKFVPLIADKLRFVDERGTIGRVAGPSVRALPANIAGLPWDLTGLLSYIPGPDDLVGMGYEAVTGETPGFLERSREAGKSLRETAAKRGVLPKRIQFEKWARSASKYLTDKGMPDPFYILGTDMTPESRNLLERMLESTIEFGLSGAAEVKTAIGSAQALQGLVRIFRKSIDNLGERAASPENVKNLIDRFGEAYSIRTPEGRANIRGELYYGAAAGPMSEGALYGLEQVDPNAAGWLQGLTGAGAAIVGPVLGRSVVTSLFATPATRWGREAIWDPLADPARTGARFEQKALGGTEAGRQRIARVGELLALAMRDGRHVDEAAGLAFTTPELARSEALILRERLRDAEADLDALNKDRVDLPSGEAGPRDPSGAQRLENFIATTTDDITNLNQYANFQESVLRAAYNPAGESAAHFFAVEAQRLQQRRDQFFNVIENQFKEAFDDLNFGGRQGGSKAEWDADYDAAKDTGAMPKFEETRRKLVMEADPKGIEAMERQFLTPEMANDARQAFDVRNEGLRQALADAREAAEGRAKKWIEDIDSLLAERGFKSGEYDKLSPPEQIFVGKLIRDTYDDACREFKALETAAYQRVRGLDDKVTENIVFPEGSRDAHTNKLIEGMEVSEWAALRLEEASRSETFNLQELPPQLAQLTGSNSMAVAMRRLQRERASEATGTIRIEDLEQQRGAARAELELAQTEKDALKKQEISQAREERKSLTAYIRNVSKGDADKAAQLRAFANDPDINWNTFSADDAKAMAPAGLKQDFAAILRKKQKILKLSAGTDQVSPELKRSLDKLSRLEGNLSKIDGKIESLTAQFFGGDDLVVVQPTGRLTSLDSEGNLVRGGTSASDVTKTITDIGEAIRKETHAINEGRGSPIKRKNLVELRTTLEQLLSPEVFKTLDPEGLSFARETAEVRNRVETASREALAKTPTGEPVISEEMLAVKTAPSGKTLRDQEEALRQIRTATAETPDFVTIRREFNPETNQYDTLAVIDETALDSQSLLDRADSPFERITIGQREGNFEVRLKSGFPPTERGLKVVENSILEQLALSFPTGHRRLESKELDAFRQEYSAALKFLENNGRDTLSNLLKDADAATEQVRVMNNILNDKTKTQLNALIEGGQINTQGLGVDEYLEAIAVRRRNAADSESYRRVVGAEPGYAVNTWVEDVLNSNHPKNEIYEQLSLVRGTKAAEDGLKAAFIADLFGRSTTRADLGTVQTQNISATFFDPQKFRDNLQNTKMRMIIHELFPDNPALLEGLDKLALVAVDPSPFVGGNFGTRLGKTGTDALVDEVWGNLGRVAGLGAAKRTGFVNELYAAGAGGRIFKRVGQNVTGNTVKDIVTEAALDPQRAVEMARKTAEDRDFFATLKRGALDTANIPKAILERAQKTPGAFFEVITEPLEKEAPVEEQSRLVPEAAPIGPPTMASRTPPAPARPPVAGSTLDRPIFAGASPPSGPVNRETMAQLQNLGMPLFASKGGLASLKKKKKSRQMVY